MKKLGALLFLFTLFSLTMVSCLLEVNENNNEYRSYETTVRYTIHFNSNGGTGSMADMKDVPSDTDLSLSPNAFEKPYCTFEGWSLSPEQDVIYTDGNSAAALSNHDGDVIVLYAKWVMYLQIDENGQISIPENCSSEKIPAIINIPSIVNGQQALSVCEDFLLDNSTVEQVFMPEGFSNIKDAAFASCDNLEKVKFPNSLERINIAAFAYCTSLETVELPASLTKICASAFRNCTGLKKIIIPSSVTEIEDNAFCDCTSLTEIVFVGSREQYRNIIKGTDIFKNCPLQEPSAYI